MIRNPDNCRRLIVSEDDDGFATGVMFLNSNVDVDTLNQNFELRPYNGLRKIHEKDKFLRQSMQPASKTFFSIFWRKSLEESTEELVFFIVLRCGIHRICNLFFLTTNSGE